jgi:hypothetical protein
MKMLKVSYEEAKSLLSAHRDTMDKIAAFLIEKETITGKEFMEIFHEAEGIDPNAPKEKTEERIGMKEIEKEETQEIESKSEVKEAETESKPEVKEAETESESEVQKTEAIQKAEEVKEAETESESEVQKTEAIQKAEEVKESEAVNVSEN